MVTKTQEEWDMLTPAEQKAHLLEEEKIVFGQDIEKKKGHPVERGVGAQGRETHNHFTAILKYEGPEAHQAALEEIWKRDPERAKKLNLPKPKPQKAA